MANNHALYYFRKSNNMAYSVEITYSKNQDYTNPQTVTEAGKPSTIDLENLDSNQTYYTKAVLKNDGTVEDEDTYTFTTLPAGTIALTHQSSTRQGSNYVVVYTYTSTYALSSSVLRCGASIAVQGVIAGNTITYTVSGLTPGDAYISQITTIDIYAESNVVTATLVMPVVNTINIVDTAPSDTEVEVELEYTVDGGFYEGFVSCWESTQDPDTDPSLQHWAFHNGTTIVYCDNLTAGTTYKFRADIVLGDMTTEIHSSVVTVTTEAGTETECFYVKNVSNSTGTFTISSDVVANNVQYYVPSTNNWMWVTSVPKTISVASGEKLYLRGGSSQTVVGGSDTQHFTMDVEHEIGGDIRSLLRWQDFQTNRRGVSTVTAIPDNAFRSLFYNDINLINAKDTLFGNVTIGINSLRRMFYGCTRLLTSANLSGVTRIGADGLHDTYNRCTSLTTPANLSSVTSIDNAACIAMYYNCGNLSYAYAPNVSTWNNSKMNSWLLNVAATGIVHKPRNLTIPTDTTSGVPTGWTTQDYD